MGCGGLGVLFRWIVSRGLGGLFWELPGLWSLGMKKPPGVMPGGCMKTSLKVKEIGRSV